jgi:hypothetical protein
VQPGFIPVRSAFLAWLAVLLGLVVRPEVARAQLGYTIDQGTVTITNYSGAGDVTMTIPAVIGGLPVTRIGPDAFAMGGGPTPYRLHGITLPSTVTDIGQEAFAWEFLTNVVLDTGLTNIGFGAFGDCYELPTITIPPGVRSIDSSAFGFCPALTEIYFDGDAPSADPDAFDSAVNLTIFYDPTTTGWGASFCGHPTDQWIGDGTGLYADATGFTIAGYFELGGAVDLYGFRGISDLALYDCVRLTSVMIPASITTIGIAPFAGCTNLSAITVDAANDNYSSLAGVLFDKSRTRVVEFPGGQAGGYTVPNGVISIGDDAFAICPALTSVTIPNGVTWIMSGAFYDCPGLTNVSLPDGLAEIDAGAFYLCSRLADLALPDSVQFIGNNAFGYCRNLTSLSTGNGLAVVGDWNLMTCSNLTSVTLGTNVNTIGPNAFHGCVGLTNVTIGANVASIGAQAFAGCPSLANITIPASVTAMDLNVFQDCPGLTAVYFEGNAPPEYVVVGGMTVDNEIFNGDAQVVVYYVPGTTGWGGTYEGCPTAVWLQSPVVQTSPQTQTAEAGSDVCLSTMASDPLPVAYFWYFDDTNLLAVGTNGQLELTNVQSTQSGAYVVVVSNVLGAVTSSPASLDVIAPVEHRPVPGVNVAGEAGSLVNIDFTDALGPYPNWTALGAVSLAGGPQYCFDTSAPLPPERFYRAWQAGTPSQIPWLNLRSVPAVAVTGSIGSSWRVDYINQFGPTNAWNTLATVTLTNASQFYFDLAAMGQPPRLYRLVPVP